MSVFYKKTIRFSLILLAFFSIANSTFAQESISNSMSLVSNSTYPNNPRAGDSVLVKLSSDLIDLDSSKITWYVDGAIRKETSKNITIKTKITGDKTVVRAVVETSDGIIKETTAEILPAGVDLIIEPISYSSPFYKGKPLFTAEGTVKIIAIPDVTIDGVKVSPKDLTFKWSRGGMVLGSNSGKGMNYIVINSTIPVGDIDIAVQILNSNGDVLVQNSKSLILNKPKLLFYENNPLYGILYNKAITNFYNLGAKEELKVVAKPFSFNFLKDTPDEATYTWYVNGNIISPGTKANELLLKQTISGGKGAASISLDLKDINKLNQYSSGGFDVQFGQ